MGKNFIFNQRVSKWSGSGGRFSFSRFNLILIISEGWKEAYAAYEYRARSARELALQKGQKVLLQKRMK